MDKAVFPTLLAQWRDESKLASEAERRMFEAAMQYINGQGPQPSDEFMEQVRELRAHAGELFKELMAQSQRDDQHFTPRPPPDQHTRH